MKPFLILQSRPNDAASDNEYEAFLKFGGLQENEAERVRMELDGLPDIKLDDYSGVIIGGGPTNACDPVEKKNEAEITFEAQLSKLLDEIIEQDFPYLGVCYGVGAITKHQRGVVSKEKYSEDVSPVTISVTEEGAKDPLLENLPKEFRAIVGHKEACDELPEGAVLLARGEACPNQMFRIKENIYATQFHPELDIEGLIVRVNIYKHAGYFPPEDAEKVIEACKKEDLVVPVQILKRFVDRYRA